MVKKALLIAGEDVYVYILRLSDGTYYTGMTNDRDRRFKEHRNGRSKSTRQKLPMEVVYVERTGSRQAGRNLEVRVKSVGAERWMSKKLFSGEIGEEVVTFRWDEERQSGKRIKR